MGGGDDANMHSEPDMSTSRRVFLAVLPGDKGHVAKRNIIPKPELSGASDVLSSPRGGVPGLSTPDPEASTAAADSASAPLPGKRLAGFGGQELLRSSWPTFPLARFPTRPMQYAFETPMFQSNVQDFWQNLGSLSGLSSHRDDHGPQRRLPNAYRRGRI